MTPRVASEIGLFSTNSACQIASACSRFGHIPIALGRNARRAEQFRFQIVIGQQLVDAPQTDAAKLRRKQVSMYVDKWCRREYFFTVAWIWSAF